MKKKKISLIIGILFLVSFFDSTFLYSLPTDTVKYSAECEQIDNNKTELTFKLSGDSLHIIGKIEANCCGEHFLTYKISSDSIYIFRLDTGALCDCMCSYDIDLKIGKCSSEEYTVCIAKYGLENEWEQTALVKKYNFITETARHTTIKIYPNPFDEQAVLEFNNLDDSNFIFEVIDQFGRTVQTKYEIIDNKIIITKNNLSKGIYTWRLICRTNSFTGKLIIY